MKTKEKFNNIIEKFFELIGSLLLFPLLIIGCIILIFKKDKNRPNSFEREDGSGLPFA